MTLFFPVFFFKFFDLKKIITETLSIHTSVRVEFLFVFLMLPHDESQIRFWGEIWQQKCSLFLILLILYMILNAFIIRTVNWFLKRDPARCFVVVLTSWWLFYPLSLINILWGNILRCKYSVPHRTFTHSFSIHW